MGQGDQAVVRRDNGGVKMGVSYRATSGEVLGLGIGTVIVGLGNIALLWFNVDQPTETGWVTFGLTAFASFAVFSWMWWLVIQLNKD